MSQHIVLTGIKPTGAVHVGNYVAAIKPALRLAKDSHCTPLYFIADYHGLTFIQDKEPFRHLSYGIAATWLAMGLDPERVVFYRQSDVPEVFELHWILSCVTPKGLMNRAHAYKAIVDKNGLAGADADAIAIRSRCLHRRRNCGNGSVKSKRIRRRQANRRIPMPRTCSCCTRHSRLQSKPKR